MKKDSADATLFLSIHKKSMDMEKQDFLKNNALYGINEGDFDAFQCFPEVRIYYIQKMKGKAKIWNGKQI